MSEQKVINWHWKLRSNQSNNTKSSSSLIYQVVCEAKLLLLKVNLQLI